MAKTTILHMLEHNAETLGQQPAYFDKLSGQWSSTSWREFSRLTRLAARAMIALEIDEGAVVSILGANRPEWTIGALGAMRVGGIAAGVYTTNSPDEVAYIVNHADSPLVIAEDLDQLAKIEQKWSEMPTLRFVVLMDGVEAPDDPRVLSWEHFLSTGDSVPESEIDDRLAGLRSDQVADFIYTSGTTGPPKAVMLTHENLVFTAELLGNVMGLTADEAMVSYLPLSHIAEQLATIHIAIAKGYAVHYCHDGTQLTDYIADVQPTTFFGVPRVWERFYAAVSSQLSETEGMKAKILHWSRGVASKVVEKQNRGEEPDRLLALQFTLANRLVFAKLRGALGLTRTKLFISGAAPISMEILEFFASLGIPITELYGQSEGSGPTTSNLPGATKFGSVGRPLPGVEVRISDHGEILFEGKNVFAGYFKDDAATADILDDGWLHSGDLGQFDEDGYLHITGRAKDIIITSGGKNVAPKNLEGALVSLELVSQAVCVGEQQRYLVALLTLDEDAAARFAEENGIAPAELADHPKLRERLQADIDREVNTQFARVEQIRNFRVLPNQFSIETGELTPTFKIKRSVVNEHFASEIEDVYADGQLM